MSGECDFQVTTASESKALLSVVPCVARLSLAILIALVALIVLCDRLSMARHQVPASHTVIMTEPADRPTRALRARTQDVPIRCRHSALSGTKQIAPLDPDTGSAVSVSFIITGLGLKQVDVVLVHDVSGSMGDCITPGGESCLKAAKVAALTFVKALSDTDRAGVVAHHSSAWVVQSLVSDQNVVTNAITDDLPASEGRTNIGEGIQAGYRELITDHWRPKAVKAMILLSDGGANEPRNHPVYDPEGYARFRAEEAGRCGILIYTIGLGQGVNKTLMQDIADLSGGEYFFSPDGSDLETIYREIALELRNPVITDTLLPGVDVDCSLWPPGRCSQADGLTTTVVLSPGNEILITNPLALSFTATVNLDPGYKGPISTEDPRMCYNGPGGRQCQSIKRRTITVGGRRISGVVFDDLDRDGHFGEGEGVLSGVVVTAGNGLTSVTDISGVYVLRTSATPALTVAVRIPLGYVSTTSETTRLPPLSGIYQLDFGLHCLGPLPIPLLGLATDAQVVRPETDVTYTYTVSHAGSSVISLTDVIVEDSHLGTVSPTHFTLPPSGQMALTATASLTQNRTSTATVTGGVGGCPWRLRGDPATATVHVIAGVALTQVDLEPPAPYHGNSTALHYCMTNQDVDDEVVSGTILVKDTLSRVLDRRHFDLDPSEAIPFTSSSFAVPQDIMVTIAATAVEGIQRTLLVSDLVTTMICPIDIYEPDDNPGNPDLIHLDELQIHDFYEPEDEDWVLFRQHLGDQSLYVFTARPLGPNGVHLCLTLCQSNITLTTKCNTNSHQSPVRIQRFLSCPTDGCDYSMQIQSPSYTNGCGTDYELSVKKLRHLYLPVILRDS